MNKGYGDNRMEYFKRTNTLRVCNEFFGCQQNSFLVIDFMQIVSILILADCDKWRARRNNKGRSIWIGVVLPDKREGEMR